MNLDLQPFSLSLAEPLRTADGTIEERSGHLVRVRTERRRGLGEATPLPDWTESPEACRAALERAESMLPLRGPEATLAAMADAPAARHGLALALADLRARRLSIPLARHLGGSSRRRRIAANATIGDASPQATAEAAAEAVDVGFDCLKVKVGARDLSADLERVAAVRERIGDAPTLRLDANGGWDRDTAGTAFERLAAHDVEYVEQPLPAGDLDGLASLRGRGVDVAVDETLAVADHDRVLSRPVADVVVCKPMVLGGPQRTVALGRRARRAGVAPVVSTTVDGVVARLGALHAAAALAPIAACGLATAGLLAEDLGPDPAPVEDGALAVPRGPGTGLRLAGE